MRIFSLFKLKSKSLEIQLRKKKMHFFFLTIPFYFFQISFFNKNSSSFYVLDFLRVDTKIISPSKSYSIVEVFFFCCFLYY